MSGKYGHQVLMICPWELREQASKLAAEITGNPRDADPDAFFGRVVEGEGGRRYGLCMTPARAEAVQLLAQLQESFPGAVYMARRWNSKRFNVDEILSGMRLHFVDEESDER
jgi:hypothetical protein